MHNQPDMFWGQHWLKPMLQELQTQPCGTYSCTTLRERDNKVSNQWREGGGGGQAPQAPQDSRAERKHAMASMMLLAHFTLQWLLGGASCH